MGLPNAKAADLTNFFAKGQYAWGSGKGHKRQKGPEGHKF
jgi:hypothetical protein